MKPILVLQNLTLDGPNVFRHLAAMAADFPVTGHCLGGQLTLPRITDPASTFTMTPPFFTSW